MDDKLSNKDVSVETILASCTEEKLKSFADLGSRAVFKMPLIDLIESLKTTSKPFTVEGLRALAESGIALVKSKL